jgi:hypothetical protein
MPYEGEFAQYQPLKRIADSDRVKHLLRRARVSDTSEKQSTLNIEAAPTPPPSLPDFVVAIDGSSAEVPVKNGYPGAHVGYLTVASVLLNLKEVRRLDAQRPINPQEFRKTEEAATIDAALPGANVVTRDHISARHSFRESVFEVFSDVIIDEEDRTSLLETYQSLLSRKPQGREQQCPYEADGCEDRVRVSDGLGVCSCPIKRSIYSTDALRLHETFRDYGTNGEAYGELMQVWERVLMVHLLRCFERRGWWNQLTQLAFFLDGPLAVFGHPAWLSAAIKTELKRINKLMQSHTGQDLLIVGIEKTGSFVIHFEELDRTDSGVPRFPNRSYLLPTDRYIKERIIFSTSEKRYGEDTYFGRKCLYKTQSGARIVATLPYLNDDQDTLESDNIALYPQFASICALIDSLVSSRYANAVAPLVAAHAQAAIPLHLGAKVLEQLARALVKPAGVR